MNFLKLKTLLFVFCCFMSATSIAQIQKISGKVTSDDDNKPLSGVSIIVKGKTTGTQTNTNGEFSIEASNNDVLVFSFTSYVSQELKVGTASYVVIVMKTSTTKLDEVVVIGYGTQKRKELTGAISTVNTLAFAHSPSSNVFTALQGTVPGLRVFQSTGQPGTSPTLAFRGGTNFDGSGTPLFVVDGMITPTLFGLDMNDIASMDLLKDAASTAIYGARAANGVVLVTTKKGKRGKTQVTYSISSTTNYIRPNSSEYLSGADYIRMNRSGLRARFLGDSLDNNINAMNTDRGQLIGAWGWALSSGNTSPTNGLYTTQLVSNQNKQYLTDPAWKLLLDRNPFNQGQTDSILYRDLSVKEREALILQQENTIAHNLNFSGATEQGSFALSIGAVTDNGIILDSKMKRFNMNFNGGLNVGKNIKLTTTITAYTTTQALPYNDPAGGATGGLLQRFIGVAPTVRYNNDTSGALLPGPNDITLGNPLIWSKLFTNSTDQQRFLGGLNLEYTILPYLKFLVGVSGYYLYTTNNFFTKAFQQGNGGAFNTTRSASFNNTKDIQYTTNAFLQFNKNFKGHNITALAGGEFYEFKRYVSSGVGQGAPTDLIPWLTAITSPSVFNGTIVNPSSASSNFSGWEKIASAIGRVNYSYQDRYLLTAVVRYDGSSRLNRENFYGLFPGVSAGWNLHNEKFYETSGLTKYVSSIKPRLSYGVNGNNSSLGFFSTAQTYSNAGTYNGAGGTFAGSYINPNVRWERTNSFNLGLDLGFLKNRITLNFDYFRRNVFDKLSSLGISAQTGFTGFTTNLGQLQNRGIELAINAQVIAPKKTDGVSLDMGATFYTVKSYAIKLPFNGLPGNRQSTFQVWDPKNPGQLMQVNGLVEGKRIGLDEVWAPRYDGIYTAQDLITKDANVYNSFLPYNNKKIKQLGDARWHLVNANDTMDSRQFVYVGRTIPQFTGSFYANAGFRGFHLYTAFDYAAGFVVNNNEILRGLSQVQGSQNGTTDVLNTWSPENTSGTLPRYYWANQGRNFATDASGNNTPANLWEKGDYIMLREVTLSYDLSQSKIKKYLKDKIKGLSVYITGSNLSYFTKYSGNFPEQGGIDNGKYPLPKRLTLGAKITL